MRLRRQGEGRKEARRKEKGERRKEAGRKEKGERRVIGFDCLIVRTFECLPAGIRGYGNMKGLRRLLEINSANLCAYTVNLCG